MALHSTTAPVELEKSIRLVGSFRKTGPLESSTLEAAWTPFKQLNPLNSSIVVHASAANIVVADARRPRSRVIAESATRTRPTAPRGGLVQLNYLHSLKLTSRFTYSVSQCSEERKCLLRPLKRTTLLNHRISQTDFTHATDVCAIRDARGGGVVPPKGERGVFILAPLLLLLTDKGATARPPSGFRIGALETFRDRVSRRNASAGLNLAN